ncbi:ABC transporter permease [Clostridiales bacterium PH28_bin88]|nr:ABC transporter permease [Clostridiales bacterium PH28_bin88]
MYELVVAVNIGIFVLLALSLNIITGYAGQPTLGHAAFFGIGAYTSAVLTAKLGFGFWLALPLAGVVAGLVGTVLGVGSLRVREDFLAVTTIGINFVVVAIFQYVSFFGASLGMAVPAAKIFGATMTTGGYLVLTVSLIVLTLLLCRRISSSWLGLALGGVRNEEQAAASLGIDVSKFKVIAFALGTALAGLAGSVYAHFMGFIMSSDFGFLTSVSILSMTVLGGMGTLRGPVVGAILLGLAPELFRFISDYRMLVYGGLLVVMMRFQHQGLLGDRSFLWNLITRALRRRAVPEMGRDSHG